MASQTSQLDKLRSMQSDNTEFKREIGVFGGVSIIGGIMIGSGIFYLGSYVLQRTGMSMGFALLCWAVGGIVTLMMGLCYAELGAMLPRAGGGYVYLREAYHPALAFMNGFSSLFVSGSGSITGLALALAGVIAGFVPALAGGTTQKIVAVAFIAFLTELNILGVKVGATIQNVFMVAKLVPITLIIVLGLFMGTQSPDLSIMPASNPGMGEWIGMLAFGVVATLWAYEGWVNLNTVTEEIKDPKKNLPRAIVIAIVMVMVLYTLFNFCIYRTLPFGTIDASINGEPRDLYLGTQTAQTLMGPTGLIIVRVGMLVSMFGSLNGCIMVFPRSYYAMAQDGAMMKSFGKLHDSYKTPVSALIASGVVSCALALVNDLNQITNLVVFSGMIYKALTFAAIPIFRKRFPELDRPYKVVGYPWMVYLTIFISIALMVNSFMGDPWTSLYGLVVPAIGFAVYMISNRGASARSDA